MKQAQIKVLKNRCRVLYSQGLQPKDITKELGVTQKTIERWRREDQGSAEDWEKIKETSITMANQTVSQTETEKVLQRDIALAHRDTIDEMVEKRKKLINETLNGLEFIHSLTTNELKPIRSDVVGHDSKGNPITKLVISPNQDNLDALETAVNILQKIHTNRRKALGLDNEAVVEKEKQQQGEQNFIDRIRSHQNARGHIPTDPNILKFTRPA
jgi:predicted transcriptional regulator